MSNKLMDLCLGNKRNKRPRIWLKISCIPHLFISFVLSPEYRANIKLYLIKRNLAGYRVPSATAVKLIQNGVENLSEFHEDMNVEAIPEPKF